MVRLLTIVAVSTLTSCADPTLKMVALEIVAVATDADGMVTVPVNVGLALGTLFAFNDSSDAMRPDMPVFVTCVISTTAPNTSELVSFSKTSSSICVLENA
jgi:hypothetical protein